MLNCINTNTENSSSDSSISNLKVNYIAPSIICYESIYYLHFTFSIIFSLIFCIISVLFLSALYDTRIKKDTLNAKICLQYDKLSIFIKILICVLFCFFDSQNDWILIVVLFLLAIILFYSYYYTKPFLNNTLYLLNFFSVSVFLWASFICVLGKVLQKTRFDGCIPLFFIGILVILFTLLLKKDNYMRILLPHLTKFKHGNEFLIQIRKLLLLYNRIDKDRNAKIILQGYAFQYESHCLLVGCPLKKYIELLEKEHHMPYLFLQHTQILFESALGKFPFDNTLRLSYCYFLLEYLNKKRTAIQELETIENCYPNYEQQFIVYRYKKLIEEQAFDYNIDESIDVISAIAYEKTLSQFKEIINKITVLYIDFWTLLLNKSQDQDQFTTLNNYGTKIITEVEKLQNEFDKLLKIKQNDQEVLCYYSDFLEDILNNKKLALEYKLKINSQSREKRWINDSLYFNLDLHTLTTSDEHQFIVLSGLKEKFALITNISLGVCLLFGFTKEELIGKSCDLFLPEILQKTHSKLLHDKVSDFKKEMKDIVTETKYTPAFKQITSFGRMKARYLVPVTFKVGLIFTEQLGISFIAKVISDKYATSEKNSSCYLLTNNRLIIQNFTVNSVNMLGITSYSMNNTVEITKFIKQFNEELLKTVLDNEELSFEQKLAIKRQIINKRFRSPSLINWKLNDNHIQDIKLFSSKSKETTTSFDFSKLTKMNQDTFKLSVQDVHIGEKQEGYIFKFETSHPTTSQFYSFHRTNINNADSPKKLSASDLNQKQINKNQKDLFINEMSFENLKTFIPQNKAHFVLDSQKMSYIQNSTNALNFKIEIKEKAMDKIHANSQNKDDNSSKISETENESSLFQSNDYSENESSNDNDYSQSKNGYNDTQSNAKQQKKESSKEMNSNREFYRVNMANIKLSIYSFDKKMLIETPNYPKKSQVDLKIFDEDDKQQKKEANKDLVEDKNKIQEEEKKENIDKEGILIKQIEYALLKEDSQPTITKLRWATFIILLYFLGFGAGWLVMVIDAGSVIKENFVLISSSYKLLTNALNAHTLVRELTCLSHPNYTSIYGPKEKVIAHMEKELNTIYSESYTKMLQIMTSTFSLTKNNSYTLNNSTIITTVIRDDYNIAQYNMTLSAAFMEINTGLFHIINDISEYYATNSYIFFYIFNLNNNICSGLERQAKIFIEESLDVINNYKTYCYIFISIGCTVSVGTYFFFFSFFNAVSKRRESYLEVFFDIGINVIITSLEKCERFNNKMKTESLNEFLAVEGDDIDNNINVSQISMKRDKCKFNRNNNSRETLFIKISFSIFISCVIVLISLFFSFYFECLDLVYNFFKMYESQNDVFTEYKKLYRNFKEYIFDDTILIELTPVNDTFPEYLTSFYENANNKEKYLLSQKDIFPKSYSIIYNQLYHKELCQSVQVDAGKCTPTLLFSSVEYGLSTILSLLIEEMRVIKSQKMGKDHGIKNNNFTYNNTLFGTDLYEMYFPKTNNQEIMKRYFNLAPLQLFKSKEYYNIKLIFDYFLKPAFVLLNTELEKAIDAYILEKEVAFYLVSALYLFFVICLYLFIWKPFEFKLNNMIFKTKNMLSIIPKEILASLANIQTLLCINQTVQ